MDYTIEQDGFIDTLTPSLVDQYDPAPNRDRGIWVDPGKISHEKLIDFFNKDTCGDVQHLWGDIIAGTVKSRRMHVFFNESKSLTGNQTRLANKCFLRGTGGIIENEDIVTKLTRTAVEFLDEGTFVQKIANDKEYFGSKVLVPHGIELYLSTKYNWTEEDARRIFLEFKI